MVLGFLPGMSIGGPEMLIILVLAVLLFGRRLPEVARSLGASYNQLKKGLHDITKEVNVDQPAKASSSKMVTVESAVESREEEGDFQPEEGTRFSPPEEYLDER
ncbi:MAG: twin-arginine translocase TatA/TatE family subunit [Pirellulaceae bacterium]|nr:twin-arginine translocase TatA/TatE family subunit [Pirellulaceae bacterium]